MIVSLTLMLQTTVNNALNTLVGKNKKNHSISANANDSDGYGNSDGSQKFVNHSKIR